MSSIFTRVRRSHLRIGIVGEFHPRLFKQQHRVMAEIAEEGERFAFRF
jgi:hypothetical protein